MNLGLSRPIVTGDYHTNVKHVSIGIGIGIDMSFFATLSVDADYYVVNSPEGVQLLTKVNRSTDLGGVAFALVTCN